MDTREVRADLKQLRAYVQAGQLDQALATIEHALRAVDPDQLLTTTAVARLLGIRSVNTLKGLLRAEAITTVRHGNRTMIPLAEVERLRDSLRVRQVQVLDRLHNELTDLGSPEGLSEEELADLEAGRPGRLPWMPAGEPQR